MALDANDRLGLEPYHACLYVRLIMLLESQYAGLENRMYA